VGSEMCIRDRNHTPMVDIPLTKEELDTKKEEIEKN